MSLELISEKYQADHDQLIEVCQYCLNEVRQAPAGEDDSISVCPECGCVEGHTRMITLAEWDDEHG